MGFKDQNGISLINDAQKIRIALSERATITMADDMNVFSVTKAATFINTVFEHYRSESKSSISQYLQNRKEELNRLFISSGLDDNSREKAIRHLLEAEKQEIIEKNAQYLKSKASGKLYHINKDNIKYLTEECTEDIFYKRPGQYIRSVIEEYCSLPFIQRERIYRKEIYRIIEDACEKKNVLKLSANYYGECCQFYVCPYKIVPDAFHTQSYLVCYSRKAGEKEQDKIVASFSMARINLPTRLDRSFYLNRQEISEIENRILNASPAYLIGKPEQIHVRLTDKGKQTYRTKLFSRPEKIEKLSTDDEYVFDCTPLQIFNYFFSFGADAEIISPEYLRNRFKARHAQALALYNQTQS